MYVRNRKRQMYTLPTSHSCLSVDPITSTSRGRRINSFLHFSTRFCERTTVSASLLVAECYKAMRVCAHSRERKSAANCCERMPWSSGDVATCSVWMTLSMHQRCCYTWLCGLSARRYFTNAPNEVA